MLSLAANYNSTSYIIMCSIGNEQDAYIWIRFLRQMHAVKRHISYVHLYASARRIIVSLLTIDHRRHTIKDKI